MWSAERINPDRQDTKPFALQTTAEYRFIRDRVTGLNVADIGCGPGFGSAILAEGAQHVTGVDRSAEAIAWAEVRYGNSILSFLCADAMDLPSQGMRFQAVVISHFLEHVIDQHDLIRLLKQMLVPPGFLCVATPNRLTSSYGQSVPLPRTHARRAGRDADGRILPRGNVLTCHERTSPVLSRDTTESGTSIVCSRPVATALPRAAPGASSTVRPGGAHRKSSDRAGGRSTGVPAYSR